MKETTKNSKFRSVKTLENWLKQGKHVHFNSVVSDSVLEYKYKNKILMVRVINTHPFSSSDYSISSYSIEVLFKQSPVKGRYK